MVIISNLISSHGTLGLVLFRFVGFFGVVNCYIEELCGWIIVCLWLLLEIEFLGQVVCKI